MQPGGFLFIPIFHCAKYFPLNSNEIWVAVYTKDRRAVQNSWNSELFLPGNIYSMFGKFSEHIRCNSEIIALQKFSTNSKCRIQRSNQTKAEFHLAILSEHHPFIKLELVLAAKFPEALISFHLTLPPSVRLRDSPRNNCEWLSVALTTVLRPSHLSPCSVTSFFCDIPYISSPE